MTFCGCEDCAGFSYLVHLSRRSEFLKRKYKNIEYNNYIRIVRNRQIHKESNFLCEPCTKYVGKPFTRHSIWSLALLGTKSNGALERFTNIYVEMAVFNEQTVYLTTFKELCPKCTCNYRKEIFMGNKYAFFSSRLYFSADSKFTYKAFLSSSLKKVQKHTLIFKSFALSAITLHAYILFHMKPWLFLYQQTITCLTENQTLTRNVFLNISENYWRASSSGTVSNCFYDLGLSRLGFEHPTFRMRGERSNQLSKLFKYQNTQLIMSTWFF